MQAAALALRARGARAVLLKGGHLEGATLWDLLLDDRGERWFQQRRLPGESHGTGCSLSSAVAAGLAAGRSMDDAVADAIAYVQRGLAAGYRPGKGRLRVLDHLAASPLPDGNGPATGITRRGG
jgi:hydroxymethylpyrimidine/phosphomethylpyrimidine kinase